MEAFALALVVQRGLYQMLIAVAVSMLGVLVDTNYTSRLSYLASKLSWSAWQKRRTATQPHSHTATQPHMSTATATATATDLVLAVIGYC